MSLPVWLYWEGPRPPWIERCIETIVHHAADPRLLGPDEFARLHDAGDEVDLGPLHVAHRADYVRAFLLARYGGLWVDSDCVVLTSLAPVLDLVEEHGFVGHHERQGRISNAFIGSRPGGRIAEAHLANVTRLIRSGAPLPWLALGASSLMDVLAQTGEPWHRIAVERVQPICWSAPGEFLVVGTPEEHDARVNPRALCYMLSKNTVDGHLAAVPGSDLMTDGTFFRHLLDRAMARPPTAASPRRAPVRTRAALLPFCLEAVADVAPSRVLDLGVGMGRWGLLVREVCEDGRGHVHRENWRTSVEAVVSDAAAVEEYQHLLYDRVHVGDSAGFLRGVATRWDLVIVGELPGDRTDGLQVVAAALDRSDYVLLTCGLDDEAGPGHRASDLLAAGCVRHLVHHGPPDDAAFLLSRADPRRLRRAPTTEPLYQRIFTDNLWLEAESRSGPGASLAQTGVLRSRLPELLASTGSRSVLDVPCGDLNWMRHVDLADVEYVGADIVPELAARNQLLLGGPRRRFLTLDMSADPLPRVDLVLCRDGLVHLSTEDVLRTLANVRRSGARHLLATTFPDHHGNDPIETGGWRPLNLQDPPFCLPEPITVLREDCTEGGGRYRDKSLGLWRVCDVLI